MGDAVPPPLQSPHQRSQILPQPITLITIARALYLLATGKLVHIPDVLLLAPFELLFNHFKEELVADPDWTRTLARIDYAYYGYKYILNTEANHFASQAYNMIHQDLPIQVPACYQRPQIDLPPITYTLEPMDDKHPVPLPRATMPTSAHITLGYTYATPSYVYPQGYGPPCTQGPPRLFAAASTEAGPSNQPQPLGKPQPPSGPPPPPVVPAIPQRWAPPRFPSPPKPLDPPAPWTLDKNLQGPWVALKPNMVREPNNFNGDSNDIARFFSQCDMYFSVFNQYFRHHPHKVIFCASRFSKDVQV